MRVQRFLAVRARTRYPSCRNRAARRPHNRDRPLDMLHTPRATRGAVVAPHHLAAQAGLRVLGEGGNAIEAT
ncbi:MAG: hypothetical protein IID50_10425, partial [Proteobacteria bacterium]|nr:hypothetical protein [Pseudomonadota bacterium]